MVSIALHWYEFFVPVILQGLHGLDPLGAGYMVAGASFGWTVVAVVVAGTSEERTGRLLVAGPAMMAAGLAGGALLVPIEPAPLGFSPVALAGGGIGSCLRF